MKGKGKFRSMHIRSAENGHTVSTDYEPDADDKSDFGSTSEHVFTDPNAVVDHVNKVLSGSKAVSAGPTKDLMPAKGRAMTAQKMLRAAEAKGK